MNEKMDSRKKWASDEIQLAIQLEKNAPGEETEKADQTNPVIDSLNLTHKLYCEVLDSGAPVGLVFRLLKQLVSHQPLTPIPDEDDIWEPSEDQPESGTKYICKRLYTLTKLVHPNGQVEFNDIGRYQCFDIRMAGPLPYTGGLGGSILNEMFPIEFPYYPIGKYSIFLSRFRAYEGKDFDTIGILHIKMPSGQLIRVERYFKLAADKTQWVEIDKREFNAREERSRRPKDQEEGTNG